MPHESEPRAPARGDSRPEFLSVVLRAHIGQAFADPSLALRARTGGVAYRYARAGFTLLEVLLVLALLGIVAAFVLPDFGNVAESEQLAESARRMRGLVAMCRAEAMNQTIRYRIRIRPDGSVRTERQADALKAPHLYIPVPADWARGAVLLADVWVAAVQVLPEGPPPVRIVDEKLEFPEMEIVPTPIEEFERAVEIDFEPDGTSGSLRWVLRDTRGFGRLLTLDGRLGRVTIDDWEYVLPEELRRPDPLPEDPNVEYNPEDFQ